MSARATRIVWESALESNELLIALALADHANDFGDGIEGGLNYLCWKTGIARRTATGHLKKFLDNKWLSIAVPPAPGRATQYKLYLGRLPNKAAYVTVAKSTTDSMTPSSRETKDGTEPHGTDPTSNGGNKVANSAPHTKNYINTNGEQKPPPIKTTVAKSAIVGDDMPNDKWLTIPEKHLTVTELKARERYREQQKRLTA